MEVPAHIALLLNSLSRFNPVVSAGSDSHCVRFEHGEKAAKLTWPTQVAEVFFDFMKDGEIVLSESVEYYDDETRSEQAEDVARVLLNFLLHEVRVVQSGAFLKHKELQSCRGGEWLSIFRLRPSEV